MKFTIKLLVLSIVVSTIVVVLFAFDSKPSFKVLATDYVKDITEIYTYRGNHIVNKNVYQIGGVEIINNNKNEKVMFNKYGNELITIANQKVENFKIKENPLQIEKFNNKNLALHNEGINSFKLQVYDNDYNSINQSIKAEGYARNFIIINNSIYVLANIYDLEQNRTVGVYVFDLTTLEILNFTEMEELTFGFHMEKFGDNIEVYGNSSEIKQDLTTYLLNIKTLETNLVINSNIPVMWVSKSIKIDSYKIILNNYSIISIDNKKMIKVEYMNDQTLIDLEYDKKDKVFYLLSGDFESKKFQVQKLNQEFELIETIYLNEDSKTPTDLILEK